MTDIKQEVAAEFEKHMEPTAEGLTKYVAKRIAEHFPEGLPESLIGIISDIITTSFYDGAEWADREAMRQDVIAAPRQIIKC